MFDNLILIYGLVFAAALLVVDTVLRFVFASRRSSSEIKNRLENIKLKQGTEEAYTNLLLRRGIGRDGSSLAQVMERIYAQSGLETSRPRMVAYLVFGALASYLLLVIFLDLPTPVNFVLAAVISLLLGAMTVLRIRAMRIKKFTAQLAPAIDIIVRSLNAGHPTNAAIALVAREMPDPIGSEFGILTDQMTFGSSIDQALLAMVDRVGAEELNLLAVTITVQRGTGGNLSEILENLAKMIRDRLMIKAKIRAISAEGRVTAWIMMLFPFLLFAMIRTMVPTYFDEVWESGYGGLIVGFCLFFMLLGMLVVRKLINFDF
ncbi:type II secretion system F family protein [Maribius pontilimi]|uniref:Type II secretion system F family protein n=1 Tax=Palleronia pontilimi TaxID=1964209 RepID=A0A934MDM6_9RHOB|nr:type II secretion system F family protein [Palleronia pontilimi]MBJ3763650.1 type II secretion system F family protein [Palleronia pontilimi]